VVLAGGKGTASLEAIVSRLAELSADNVDLFDMINRGVREADCDLIASAGDFFGKEIELNSALSYHWRNVAGSKI